MSNRPMVLALATLLATGAMARSPAAAQNVTPPAGRQVSAVMVELVVSRTLDDKRLSTTPYMLSVNPDQRSSLRVGGSVPIPSTTFTPAKEDGKASAPMTSYGYRDIGTSIDIVAAPMAGDVYRLTVTIDETSIYSADVAPAMTKTTGAPAFRSFKSTNSMVMREGQTIDYVMATDRLSGEVYRVSVKMTLVR
jgi:hypothetical protein